jgi:hypothetical protein
MLLDILSVGQFFLSVEHCYDQVPGKQLLFVKSSLLLFFVFFQILRAAKMSEKDVKLRIAE